MTVVSAICVGPSALLPDGKRTAIAKHAVAGPVRIGSRGLAGDVQVNRRHHGGPEMAVHVYPFSHHRFWREQIGDHPLLDDPGAFGTNLVVDGPDETQVRIGERFRLGSVLLEVTQPRMPCATIERRFERKGMMAAILSTGRCGWFYRVLEEGTTEAGDELEPIPDTGIACTVRRAFTVVADPAAAADPDLLHKLAQCPVLGEIWRAKAAVRLGRYRL